MINDDLQSPLLKGYISDLRERMHKYMSKSFESLDKFDDDEKLLRIEHDFGVMIAQMANTRTKLHAPLQEALHRIQPSAEDLKRDNRRKEEEANNRVKEVINADEKFNKAVIAEVTKIKNSNNFGKKEQLWEDFNKDVYHLTKTFEVGLYGQEGQYEVIKSMAEKAGEAAYKVKEVENCEAAEKAKKNAKEKVLDEYLKALKDKNKESFKEAIDKNITLYIAGLLAEAKVVEISKNKAEDIIKKDVNVEAEISDERAYNAISAKMAAFMKSQQTRIESAARFDLSYDLSIEGIKDKRDSRMKEYIKRINKLKETMAASKDGETWHDKIEKCKKAIKLIAEYASKAQINESRESYVDEAMDKMIAEKDASNCKKHREVIQKCVEMDVKQRKYESTALPLLPEDSLLVEDLTNAVLLKYGSELQTEPEKLLNSLIQEACKNEIDGKMQQAKTSYDDDIATKKAATLTAATEKDQKTKESEIKMRGLEVIKEESVALIGNSAGGLVNAVESIASKLENLEGLDGAKILTALIESRAIKILKSEGAMTDNDAQKILGILKGITGDQENIAIDILKGITGDQENIAIDILKGEVGINNDKAKKILGNLQKITEDQDIEVLGSLTGEKANTLKKLVIAKNAADKAREAKQKARVAYSNAVNDELSLRLSQYRAAIEEITHAIPPNPPFVDANSASPSANANNIIKLEYIKDGKSAANAIMEENGEAIKMVMRSAVIDVLNEKMKKEDAKQKKNDAEEEKAIKIIDDAEREAREKCKKDFEDEHLKQNMVAKYQLNKFKEKDSKGNAEEENTCDNVIKEAESFIETMLTDIGDLKNNIGNLKKDAEKLLQYDTYKLNPVQLMQEWRRLGDYAAKDTPSNLSLSERYDYGIKHARRKQIENILFTNKDIHWSHRLHFCVAKAHELASRDVYFKREKTPKKELIETGALYYLGKVKEMRSEAYDTDLGTLGANVLYKVHEALSLVNTVSKDQCCQLLLPVLGPLDHILEKHFDKSEYIQQAIDGKIKIDELNEKCGNGIQKSAFGIDKVKDEEENSKVDLMDEKKMGGELL